MQLKLAAFINITAALVSASPAIAASAIWYAGANCSGPIIDTSDNIQGAGCVFLTNGGSAKSISYHDTLSIQFFISGGQNDVCSNGSQETHSGTDCATAPDGVNWESFTAQ